MNSASHQHFKLIRQFADLVRHCAPLIVSVLALAAVMSSAAYMLDLKKIGHILMTMQPLGLFAAIFFTVLIFFVNSYRFALIARWVLGKKTAYYHALRITWLGCFMALSTPIAMLGDVARAGLVKMIMRVSLRNSVEVVLFDRGFCLLCLLLFVLFSAIWCVPLMRDNRWLFNALITVPVCSLSVLTVVMKAHTFVRWPGNSATQFIRALLTRLSYLMQKPTCMLQQMIFTFINLALYAATFSALIHAMNFSFDIVALILFSPLILVVNNLPFFYMGWGGREAVLLTLAPVIAPGISSERMLSVSMLYGVIFMLTSLVGGLYFLVFQRNKNKKEDSVYDSA